MQLVDRAGDGGPIGLSVSSDGSNGMQLLEGGQKIASLQKLSVSSDGSNGMQLRPGARHDARIVFFQYPRTDRTGCNFVRHNANA